MVEHERRHPLASLGQGWRRGRRQVSPWTLGGLSVRQLAARVWAEVSKDELTDRAAALSYYFVFALFPTLLFLTTLVGLFPERDLMERLMAPAEDLLPPDAASLLRRTLREVQRGAGGGLLSVGAAVALWGASRGMVSIITALNVVYGVTNPRPWWRRQLVAVALTGMFSVLALGALLSLVFGERIGRAAAVWAGLGSAFTAVWGLLQWPLGLLLILTGIDLVYHLAPAVRQRWYWLTPGSAFAGFLWAVVSIGLRVYVSEFANYNATYGSIGGVILLLLWLYLSGMALLIGGEINSVIARAAAERGEEIAAPLDEPAKGERRPAN
ncbi:MAG TPA: YihY/virulence factor BrkB family protein [Methylomirabilota bacterium]|jgi:membrane protein|nr:YihY/virulence factor BrkB family protein [Methylomirabilota bacterium]